MKKVAILTGGGDAPGLNAAIRAVAVKSLSLGCRVRGVAEGWAGMLKNDMFDIGGDEVEGLYREGGTMLGSSRTNPYNEEGGQEKVLKTMSDEGIDVLFAIGGEDTLGVAHKLTEAGGKIIAIPKTIDNDLSETDFCIGFDTAVELAGQAVENLHTTAKSHGRSLVVEIMGRHAGWLSLYAGLAGGAHFILIPEVKFSMDEVAKVVSDRKARGKRYSIIAVSEGASIAEGEEFVTQTGELDAFGHVRLGGVAKDIADEIEKRTSVETRSVILGHLQRSGPPSAYDRIMATRAGLKAVDLASEGKFGQMVSVKGGEVASVDVGLAVGKLKTVPPELYESLKIFFG